MVKFSKRVKEAQKTFDRKATYSLKDAMENIAKFPKTKFDETVELHFHLSIDVKASEQGVRGTVLLPHGSGKSVRLAVFCKGDQAEKARALKADYVGAEDLIEKVSKGFLDFDCAIATPDIMRELSKLGRVLGPRGLMPSPKAGTVTADVERAIKEIKAGRVEFKSDKQGGIHVGIGKRSFNPNQLAENASQVIEAVNHTKPAGVKGNLVKSLFVSTTMGPGLIVSV